jgi:hypothetical protein
MTGLLDRIRLLTVDRIYPFEWTGNCQKHAEFSSKLHGVVRDPFPVLHLEQGRYVLLEAADLFRELVLSGIKHVPVQICRPSTIKISAPSIGLSKTTRVDIEDLVQIFPRCLLLARNGDPVPESHLELDFTFRGQKPARLFVRRINGAGCPEPLQDVFRAINSKGGYVPMAALNAPPGVLCKTSELSGTVRLPSFYIHDLTGAVTSGKLFPDRVIVPTITSRVLNLDFPLHVLKSERPLEEKQAFLSDLITFRNLSYRTSSFKGRVYLLNR